MFGPPASSPAWCAGVSPALFDYRGAPFFEEKGKTVEVVGVRVGPEEDIDGVVEMRPFSEEAIEVLDEKNLAVGCAPELAAGLYDRDPAGNSRIAPAP